MKSRTLNNAVRFALFVMACSAQQAAQSSVIDHSGFENCRVASTAELGEMRGGFDRGGMNLSFAIERVTYINGQMVATTRLTIPSLNAIPNPQAIVASVQQWVGNANPVAGTNPSASSNPAGNVNPVGNNNPVGNGNPVGSVNPASNINPVGGPNPVVASIPVGDINPVTVIQNGPNNTFTIPGGSLPTGALTTVIQNTLDNQKISTQTVIDATLTSQALARAMTLASSINQALLRSIR